MWVLTASWGLVVVREIVTHEVRNVLATYDRWLLEDEDERAYAEFLGLLATGKETLPWQQLGF